MTHSLKNLQGLAVSSAVLAAAALGAYVVAPVIVSPEDSLLDTSPQAIAVRLLFLAIGAALALGLCYLTRHSPLWSVTSRDVVYMVIGGLLYGVGSWLFNGITFNLPAVSQVPIRPAVVIPVFFGFAFGPVVGFVTGAAGTLIADLFLGLVSPHWALGHGLIGLVAGLPALFADGGRAFQVGGALLGLGGAAAAGFFFADPAATFQPPPDFEAAPMSLFMGLSALVGAALIILLRYILPNRPAWASAALWGGVGCLVGLSLAAMADIWIEGRTWPEAVVGDVIPAAGPRLIALAILVPLLMLAYESAREAPA